MSAPVSTPTPLPAGRRTAAARPGRRRRGTGWAADLLLGARLSVGGGRSGWARLVMIGLGVGIGVAMLLLVAALPSVLGARDARVADRTVEYGRALDAGPDTFLTATVNSSFRSSAVQGVLVQAEGADAPPPPGLDALPGPGEVVLSPALAELLESDDGAALRGRWGEEVVGTIGPEGLAGPGELRFYLGTDALTEDDATRGAAWGADEPLGGTDSPMLVLLGVVALAAMLVPVAIFVATAVRFGGEARDRRLAALRLVGADAVMTRRIAAGETMAGAVLGLVVGRLLYLVAIAAVREAVPGEMSFYPQDARPVPLLVALVVVLVPAAAVLVTMSALRRVVVEPLGVVRRADEVRRRLWWRVVPPVAGGAVLVAVVPGMDPDGGDPVLVFLGLALLLVGISLLLPWLVEATVRRLRGGPVAWELAVRRLQLDSGAAVRSVSAIAVCVAGLVAMHGVLAAVEAAFEQPEGRESLVDAEIYASSPSGWDELAASPAVEGVWTSREIRATPLGGRGEDVFVVVGDCTVLGEAARLDDCADGDVFVMTQPGRSFTSLGATYTLGDPAEGVAPRWTLPDTAETVHPWRVDGPGGMTQVLATPSALDGVGLRGASTEVHVALDESTPDALDVLRTAAAQVDPRAYVADLSSTRVVGIMEGVRQALFVATVALLVMVGASMLVNVVEQLRERRQLLAALLAFGTRRSTLGASVLFQVAVPVVLGLALAVLTGTGLTAILLSAVDEAPTFDWYGIGATAGVAALVVLLTTAASLPVLWRLARPTGLRAE